METLEAQTDSLTCLWPPTGSLRLLQLSRLLWNFKYCHSGSLPWLYIESPEELQRKNRKTAATKTRAPPPESLIVFWWVSLNLGTFIRPFPYQR